MISSDPVSSTTGHGWVNSVLRKALGHSLVYGMSVGLLPLASLLLLPVYTRYLSAEQFGMLALLTVTAGILTFLYDLGMINALFRRYFEHDEDRLTQRKVVLTTAGTFLITHAAWWTLFLSIMARWLPPVGSSGRITGLVQLMLLSTFVNACADVPLAVLRIRRRIGTYALIALLRSVGLIAVTWELVAVQQRGLTGVFASSLLVGLAACLVLTALTIREFTFRPSLQELRAMLKFGLPFFPVLFFTWIVDFSDRYFLGALASLQEIGVYSVGYKIGQMVLLVVKAFMVAWIPIMFSIAKHPEAPRAFAKVFRFYQLGLSVVGLAITFWAPDLIRLFATAGYQRATPIVPLIVGAYLCYGVYSFMLSGLLVTRDVWVQPLTLAGAALLNAGLNWWWIPSRGMWGAAYATIASYTVAAIVTWGAAQHRYPIPVSGRGLLTMLAVWAACGAVSWRWALPAMGKAALLLGYLVALWALRIVTPEDLPQAWGRRVRPEAVATAPDAVLAAK